ncbi:unnamed protein product [Ectocarpus sp. CCAP 1310/34]|nr:unnamed protein product [Ectocarpus sp. CCAP 1310/34]
MESLGSLTYRELQAFAKRHGVKANGSRVDLIQRLCDTHGGDDDTPVEDNTQPGSDDRPDTDNDTPVEDTTQPGSDGTTLGVSDTDADNLVTRDRPHGAFVQSQNDSDLDKSQQGKSDSQALVTDTPAEPQPRAVGDVAERCKSGNYATIKETRTTGGTPQKTKVKLPVAGRFERAHQSLFASQASIERYGKTPKKSAPAKGNVPLSKTKASAPKAKVFASTPVRPVDSGSGAKSSVKRGLTVASMPCTLVVQRSTKKPTQVKEFRLSSNQTGKRETFTFKPYTGPLRPIVSANNYSFNIGHAPKKGSNPVRPKGIKATLASGKGQKARREAHVESSKAQRDRKLAEARCGRA